MCVHVRVCICVCVCLHVCVFVLTSCLFVWVYHWRVEVNIWCVHLPFICLFFETGSFTGPATLYKTFSYTILRSWLNSEPPGSTLSVYSSTLGSQLWSLWQYSRLFITDPYPQCHDEFLSQLYTISRDLNSSKIFVPSYLAGDFHYTGYLMVIIWLPNFIQDYCDSK